MLRGGIVSVTRRGAPSPSQAMLALAAGARASVERGGAGGPDPASADTADGRRAARRDSRRGRSRGRRRGSERGQPPFHRRRPAVGDHAQLRAPGYDPPSRDHEPPGGEERRRGGIGRDAAERHAVDRSVGSHADERSVERPVGLDRPDVHRQHARQAVVGREPRRDDLKRRRVLQHDRTPSRTGLRGDPGTHVGLPRCAPAVPPTGSRDAPPMRSRCRRRRRAAPPRAATADAAGREPRGAQRRRRGKAAARRRVRTLHTARAARARRSRSGSAGRWRCSPRISESASARPARRWRRSRSRGTAMPSRQNVAARATRRGSRARRSATARRTASARR